MAAVGEITDIVVVEAPISQRYRELSESERAICPRHLRPTWKYSFPEFYSFKCVI